MSDHRILIVDDERSVCLVVQRICEDLGLDAQYANSADEATQQALTWKPNLLIVDMVMPDTDGLDLLSGLLAAGEDVRAIVMSGYGMGFMNLAAALPKFYQAGRIWKLSKPFRKAEMVELVRTALAA